MFELILRGGKAVLPWGIETLDLGVRDGRIAAMGDLRTAGAAEVLDCRHLHVLPGLIDAHVHLREPGDPAVETIATGTRAAVLGRPGAVFDMPNTSPSITDSGSWPGSAATSRRRPIATWAFMSAPRAPTWPSWRRWRSRTMSAR
jgi:dihydroorotase